MSHLQIGILLGVVNLMACFLIIFQESGWTPAALSASGVLILFFAILFLYSLISPLDLYVYSLQWKDFELIDCRDSIYGRIALTRMNGEYSFYEHGVLTGTVPDLWTSEWSIHLPLIQHPDPKTLLLIGTGIGSLKEALKYKGVYKIDYIELDPTALSLAEKYCPPIYIEPLKDPKVHPVYKDARLHMRAKAGQEYDVIILGLPDPKTAQLNRMYTAEFFRLASDRLSENGIMAFSVTSSENYIGPQLADFLRCIYKTVRSVFPEVLIAPGDMAHFIAGGKSPFMTLDPNVITQRLYARGIETEFFSEFYIPSNLSKERISSLGDIVRNTQKVWINEDLKPICYLYDLILWGRYFSPITGNILEKAKEMDRGRLLFLCLILVLLVMSTRFLGKEKSRRQVIGLIVLLGGFIEIILEFLLVLSFQVFYGYAYLQLGILITGFMVGLTIGSAIMTHILDRLANTYKCFIGIQASYFLYPLFVIFLFKRSDLGLWPAISVEFLFLVLSLIAGFIGGLQFPIATRLFIANTEKWKGQAGLLYGLDLVGSALGAILASSYLVPLFGIPATLGVLSLTGGLCLCLLIVNL